MSHLNRLERVISNIINIIPMVDVYKMALQSELNNYMIESTIKTFQMEHKIKKLEIEVDQIRDKLNNNYYKKGGDRQL